VKVATAERVKAMANATQDDSRYLALTTYRRDGRGVTTPVWAVPLDGRIYVFTASSTGKAKRVRATGRVHFAPSSMNGRGILGAWREGTARVVQDRALQDRALAALQRKYGWQLSVAMLVYRLRGLYRDRVVLELTPAPRT
jgi:PPOX class probable F420-dependent enzyme